MLYYNYKRENKERTEPKMLTDKENYIWDTLVELGIATNEELGLAITLCGKSEQTLNRVLYIRTGYRDLEQMFDEEE
jgi:hypothetical protein